MLIFESVQVGFFIWRPDVWENPPHLQRINSYHIWLATVYMYIGSMCISLIRKDRQRSTRSTDSHDTFAQVLATSVREAGNFCRVTQGIGPSKMLAKNDPHAIYNWLKNGIAWPNLHLLNTALDPGLVYLFYSVYPCGLASPSLQYSLFLGETDYDYGGLNTSSTSPPMKLSDVKICCVESQGKQPKTLQDFFRDLFPLVFFGVSNPGKGGIDMPTKFAYIICFQRNDLNRYDQPPINSVGCGFVSIYIFAIVWWSVTSPIWLIFSFFGRPVEAHIVCWNPGTNFVFFFARYEQSRSLHATMWVAMVNSTWGNCGGDGVVQAVEQVTGWMKVVGYRDTPSCNAFWKMIFTTSSVNDPITKIRGWAWQRTPWQHKRFFHTRILDHRKVCKHWGFSNDWAGPIETFQWRCCVLNQKELTETIMGTQRTNISHVKGAVKMIFLFHRWDMC